MRINSVSQARLITHITLKGRESVIVASSACHSSMYVVLLQHPIEDDFDPDEYDEGDDLETLEEEEQLALDARESHEAEVHGLEADNELSLEELLAKYGMQSSTRKYLNEMIFKTYTKVP